MNVERDISPAVTLTRMLPAEDFVLLEEATLGLENTNVRVLKTEGESYRFTSFAYHGDYVGKHPVGALGKVPKGQVWISVRSDPHNFPTIWRQLADLKDAREERRAKQSLS